MLHMSMARSKEFPSPVPGDEIIGLLSREVLQQHMAEIERLDQSALLNTLIPNRNLPPHDPAGHIIAHHARLGTDNVHVNDAYDLGVVYARSLLTHAWPKDRLLPVISNFDIERKTVVNNYLTASKKVPVLILTRNDDPEFKNLNTAVALFAKRCESIVPHLMFDGDQAVLRGVHDYFSVVTLLEASEQDQRNAYRRLIGRVSLGERILRLATMGHHRTVKS